MENRPVRIQRHQAWPGFKGAPVPGVCPSLDGCSQSREGDRDAGAPARSPQTSEAASACPRLELRRGGLDKVFMPLATP